MMSTNYNLQKRCLMVHWKFGFLLILNGDVANVFIAPNFLYKIWPPKYVI